MLAESPAVSEPRAVATGSSDALVAGRITFEVLNNRLSWDQRSQLIPSLPLRVLTLYCTRSAPSAAVQT
jgi:hypothetical protein